MNVIVIPAYVGRQEWGYRISFESIKINTDILYLLIVRLSVAQTVNNAQ